MTLCVGVGRVTVPLAGLVVLVAAPPLAMGGGGGATAEVLGGGGTAAGGAILDFAGSAAAGGGIIIGGDLGAPDIAGGAAAGGGIMWAGGGAAADPAGGGGIMPWAGGTMPGLTQIMGAGHIVPVAGIAPWGGGAAMGMPWGQQGSFAAEPPWPGMAGGDMPAAGMCPAGAAGIAPPWLGGIAPPWLGGAIPAPPPAGISPPMGGGGAMPPPVRFFIDLPAGMAAPGACPEAPHGTHCIGGAGAPVAQEATAIQTVLTAICGAAGCWPAGGAAAPPPIGGMAPPGAGIPPPVASARGSTCERASRYFIVKTFGVGRVWCRKEEEEVTNSWQWA
ncbi:uncharacterized protein PG986_011780 [Apiospora aurea]|uniref:Uncharacterized protein n=1 Tax=Apiospora aurea TaxID=335848 RepID=A0ABR1PYP3_9PEZI